VVFVDRDGVINRNLPDGVTSWGDFEFLPGALPGLALLRKAGHKVVVVTNQANIGRGRLTRAQLDEIHRRMTAEVISAGGMIDAVYVCEHLPEVGVSLSQAGAWTAEDCGAGDVFLAKRRLRHRRSPH